MVVYLALLIVFITSPVLACESFDECNSICGEVLELVEKSQVYKNGLEPNWYPCHKATFIKDGLAKGLFGKTDIRCQGEDKHELCEQ